MFCGDKEEETKDALRMLFESLGEKVLGIELFSQEFIQLHTEAMKAILETSSTQGTLCGNPQL